MDKTTTQQIEEIITKIAAFLGVKVEKSVVTKDPEGREDNNYILSLEVDNPSVLIGKHGETLKNFQHIVRLIFRKKSEEKIHFIVDVNNYRNERKTSIVEMVNRAIKRVIRDEEPAVLDPMPAYDRKIAHNEIQKAVGIVSESIGEEPNRKVVIKPAVKEIEVNITDDMFD